MSNQKRSLIERVSQRMPSEGLLDVHLNVIEAAVAWDAETQTYPPIDLDNQALVDSIVRYLPEFSADEVRDDPDGLLMVIRAAINHGLDRENDPRLDQS